MKARAVGRSGVTAAGLRRWLGWLILLGGTAAMIDAAVRSVTASPAMALALGGGMLAAVATGLGTLPVLLAQSFSTKANDTMLGFGAGVMLAACAFSLILPGLAAAEALGAGQWGSAGIVGSGVIVGALVLLLVDRFLPHEHFIKGVEGTRSRELRRAWLFVFAIALHNLPEGLAIGVAASGPDAVGAQALSLGIAIQDVPEGLVVALALHRVGYGRWRSAGLGFASGIVEPIAAVAAASVVTLWTPILPFGLALAAGAMLFVISHEIIPESHRKGHERWAT
ncbi:MAG: ZIP family metal transporter, partial [Lautropia sp.]